MIGMDLGIVLASAIFVESVYGLPGLGTTIVSALPRADLPTIMGITLVITLTIVFLNLLIDLLYASIDPRIRVGTSIERSE
jgi:peptide/nickel transport system permease protein